MFGSDFEIETGKKKKKKDFAALNSPFMKIPRMKVEIARELLDLGFSEIYELQGRSPESIFEDLKKRNTNPPEDRLHYFRMAVYFSETDAPEPALLHPAAWQN